jgi:hypothetical protein
VDEVLWKLSGSGCFSVGYTDVIGILINGKFPLIASEVLQSELGLIQQLCDRTDLSINPSKTAVILFTETRALKDIRNQISLVKLHSCSMKRTSHYSKHKNFLEEIQGRNKCLQTVLVSLEDFLEI